LPFENPQKVISLLAEFSDFEFHIYSPEVVPSNYAHIICNALSRDKFQADLHNSAGIISNAGFELVSEALYLGKKILVKPLHSQMEQISNAAALIELNYGRVMTEMDSAIIKDWLDNAQAVRVTYPNVAKILVEWILNNRPAINQDFINHVWRDVEIIRI
jgi:uncharacterized protein (TIGR00661 family)